MKVKEISVIERPNFVIRGVYLAAWATALSYKRRSVPLLVILLWCHSLTVSPLNTFWFTPVKKIGKYVTCLCVAEEIV
jgi:hypothetical protein